MVRVQRDIKSAALCRMDAGQPSRSGIACDIPALTLSPNEAARLNRQGAAQQREAEILSATTTLALEQRGSDAIGEQSRGEVVEYRAKHQLRPVGAAALEDRHAAQALQDLVEASLLAERTRVAVARQPGVYQARIDRAQSWIIYPKPRRHRRAKILHQHIGAHHHAAQDGQPLRLFQVECQCALPAVGAEKEPAFTGKARRKLAQHVALR